MKAIVVTDQAAGTAGMTLVERPEPRSCSPPSCYSKRTQSPGTENYSALEHRLSEGATVT
jgi:hypothetical protein